MTGDPEALQAAIRAIATRNELRQRGDALLADAIQTALDSGWSLRTLGQALGMSHVMVQKHLKRNQ